MGGQLLESQTSRLVAVAVPCDSSAPGLARDAVNRLDHGLDHEREYALKLLLSELVSNSVKYGCKGPVTVELAWVENSVHAEVVDHGPGFTPCRREASLEEVGGWGLVLVEQLSSRWGSYPGSAHVWFEIDAD